MGVLPCSGLLSVCFCTGGFYLFTVFAGFLGFCLCFACCLHRDTIDIWLLGRDWSGYDFATYTGCSCMGGKVVGVYLLW